MKKILLILCVSAIPFAMMAQTEGTVSDSYNRSYFGVALGISGSTNGFGVNLNTALNKRFALRLGYEKVDKTFKDAFVYSQGDQSFNATPVWKTGGLSAILDFYLFRGFFVSGGVVYSNMDLAVKMMSGSSLKIGDIDFQPNEIGELVLNVKPAEKLAPYGAFGFGRNISRDHRLAMSLEIGTYYMQSYMMGVTGTELFAANGDPANQESVDNLNETLKGISWSGFYPVIKLGVSYKIWGENK